MQFGIVDKVLSNMFDFLTYSSCGVSKTHDNCVPVHTQLCGHKESTLHAITFVTSANYVGIHLWVSF